MTGERRPAASTVAFDRVSKSYARGAPPVVADLSFSVPAGAICALVGESGGGKTTTLKMVNRLIEPTSGDIRIDETSVRRLPAVELRRQIGYVIQSVGLLPHLTVEANAAVVPRLLGWSRSRTRERVHELLELIGLDPAVYGKRYPSQLSGGQQQRVGLARALAADPRLMLMDEPFSAVDPIVRERLRADFLHLHRREPKTVLFVTHDIDEAIAISDRVAVLREGRLIQYCTPAELLTRPADEFVAEFVGRDRFLKALALIRIGDIALDAPPDPSAAPTLEIPATASARDALALLLADPRGRGLVRDDNGEAAGVVTADLVAGAIRELARRGPQRHEAVASEGEST